MESFVGHYTIYQGNSLEIMASMVAESVDCVITDPPYRGFEFSGSVSEYWNAFIPYYEQMRRLCKGPVKRLAISQPVRRHEYIRRKLPPTSILTIDDGFADRRGTSVYFLLINPLTEQPPPAENWQDTIVPASNHPNDRGINQMAIAVKAMTGEGDTVLDPFCGSGAIGVACLLLRRKYIGIELIKRRAEDARARLAAVRLTNRPTNRSS